MQLKQSAFNRFRDEMMARVKDRKNSAKADQFKRQYKLRLVLGSLRLHAYVIRPEEKAVAAASTLW